jgi:hypothetical protein
MWILIALAIIVAGWFIVNAINSQEPTSIDAKIRTNANHELSKLIYQFALQKKTDAQIVADPTIQELIKLTFKGMDIGDLTMNDLVTQSTVSIHKKSGSYFLTNKLLAKRMKSLLSKGYDDKKIASEFCRLEGLQVQDPSLSYLQDDYRAHDITRMKVDPNFMVIINTFG